MKLKHFFRAFVSLSFVLALSSCGNSQKANTAKAESDNTAIEQEGVEEQIAEPGPQASSINWDLVMPEIVNNMPKGTVHSYFQGKIGPNGYEYNGYDVCPYQTNLYTQVADEKETHYIITILAAPYSDEENVLVISCTQAGVDGLGTLLLKSMNYNLKSKQFSNISDKIPGVEPNADLLDLSWLSAHPDWIEQIKNEYQACSTTDLFVDFGVCKVQNSFNDNDVCLSIDFEMADEVPDWAERLNLVYAWNGKTFELVK